MIINDYLFANNDLQTFRVLGFVQDKWVYEDSSNIFILTGGLRFAYWTFNNEIIFTPRLRFIYQPKIKSKV
ncbi:MAG: hypothetical protein PHI52_09915, partial [Bacteroidales bacterium]|nr:hypothetical protein [Bacteroidales bacterium]